MKKLYSSILHHRNAVLIITAVLVAVSIVSIFKTHINSNMAEYLDDSSVTKQTMSILADSFGINGDATVCVQKELNDYDSVSGLVQKLEAVENISSVTWLGSYSQLFTVENGEIASVDPMLTSEKVQALADGYYKVSDGKGYFLLSISLSVSNASKEASVAMDEYADILADYSDETGADYYLGGTVMQGKNMIDSAMGDLPIFLIAAVVIIGIILLLTSKSLVSALIFLLTIGISIVLNMGTNFFTESVSIATFSVAAILQLALSMDYSIFLTHSYEHEEKAGNPDALFTAMKNTSAVILASALTTIAGFCALFFMRYHMGADLGLCLAKGVTLSLLTVLIVQPCLMTVLKKACKKTEHKVLRPSFEKFSVFPVKHRYGALAIAAILIVPSIFFSTQLKYYYLDTDYSEQATGAQKVVAEDGSQMVFVVPLADDDTQVALLDELKQLKDDSSISRITGFYSLADTLFDGFEVPITGDDGSVMATLKLGVADILAIVENGGEISGEVEERLTDSVTELVQETAESVIEQKTAYAEQVYGRELTEEERSVIVFEVASNIKQQVTAQLTARLSAYTDVLSGYSEMINAAKSSFVADIDGTDCTYFAVSVTGAAEGEQAIETVEKIESIIYDTFGEDTSYLAAGSTQTVRDLAALTQRDFAVVAIVSVILILIILVATFKTILLPLLMVAVIELAILLNMSITALSGGAINFMTYVIISAIQLGATIDYAILLVKNYRTALSVGADVGYAVSESIRKSAFSILVSMSILASACFSVYFISGDTLIREITMMVGRGSIISAALVLLILPGILALKKDKWKL